MIANKGHPTSRFSIGNLKTLKEDPEKKNIDTYLELKKFHEKFYSSNLMSLSVLSKDSLGEIEKMVRSKFSDIQNKNIDRKAINNFTEKAFDSRNKGVFVAYKSPQEQKTLDIGFSIDASLDDFKKKPLYYLGNLIENESPNGFSVFLKENGYITSLETGIQTQSTDYTFFVIRLQLTQKGYSKIDEVTKLVFAYLRKIEKDGISKDRFEEFRDISALNFLYKVIILKEVH